MDVGKIAAFVAFLVVFVGWLVLTNWITNTWAARALINERMFAYRVRIFFSNLLANLAVVVLIFALTRNVDLNLLIILVVTSTLTNALSWLLGAVTRLHSHDVIKTGVYALELMNRRLFKIIQLIFAILIFLYPVACGIFYFTSDLADSQYIISIYRLTLLVFIVSISYLTIMQVLFLVAAFVDDRLRDLQFINYIPSVISVGLYAGLLVWTFSGSTSLRLAGGAQIGSDILSPLLFIIVTAYFLAFVFAPYFVGILRHRDLRLRLLHSMIADLNAIVARLPLRPPVDLAPLPGTAEQIYNRYTADKRRYPYLSAVVDDAEMRQRLAEYYETDVRLAHWNRQLSLFNDIAYLIQMQSAGSSEADRLTELRYWGQVYRLDRMEYERQIGAIGASRHVVWSLLVALISPLLAFALSTASERIWLQIAASIGVAI